MDVTPLGTLHWQTPTDVNVKTVYAVELSVDGEHKLVCRITVREID